MTVINHGDPEPDHNTKWVDDDGFRWAYTYDGWINMPSDEYGVEWSSIHPDHFPMEQVSK